MLGLGNGKENPNSKTGEKRIMPHSTKKFTWLEKSKTFVGELSDFNGIKLFDQIYPDSADVGIKLISEKTGKEAVYYLADEVSERGEFICYELLPTPETLKKMPQLKKSVIRIYND